MNGFEAYQEYQALKRHFTTSYDYIKYKGKTKVKYENYEKRNDRYFYEKLAKKSDLHNFLISNLIVNSKIYIKDLTSDPRCDIIYKNWSNEIQSLTYKFKSDLDKLNPDFDLNFRWIDGHPFLLKLYIMNSISIGTFCILLDLTKADSVWNQKMESDPLWSDIKFKIEKFKPFLEYDEEKMKDIVIEKFQN